MEEVRARVRGELRRRVQGQATAAEVEGEALRLAREVFGLSAVTLLTHPRQ